MGGLPRFPCVGSSPPSPALLPSLADFFDERCSVPQVWDADKEELVSCGEGHQGPVVCVAVSPDGSLLASGSMHTVRIWDTENCQERGVFEVLSRPSTPLVDEKTHFGEFLLIAVCPAGS